MITPQDIREKQFERAMLNGYSTSSVDEFMEQVATEYATLCKEISTYRKKMKMLVDKVEEYRASEDAMRLALLQAQKTCNELTAAAEQSAQDTVAGAQAQADALFARATEESNALLAAAQQQYDDVVGSISAAADLEEARLAEAQQSAALFLQQMRAFCTNQLADLDAFEADGAPALEPAVEDEPVVEDEPAAEEEAFKDDEPIEDEPVVEEDPIEEEPAVEEEEAIGDEDPVEDDEPILDDDLILDDEDSDSVSDLLDLLNTGEGDAEVDGDTKRFNFDDLKGLNFGR